MDKIDVVLGKNDNHWRVWLKGNTAVWGSGGSVQEAIWDWVRAHAHRYSEHHGADAATVLDCLQMTFADDSATRWTLLGNPWP
jgi:hypothetical protein